MGVVTFNYKRTVRGVKSPLACSKFYDDVIKWKHFSRYWPFVRGIQRSPVAFIMTLLWCQIFEAPRQQYHKKSYNMEYLHYSDLIMSTIASKTIGVLIVYSTVCSGADQRKHQSSASLALVRGLHRWPVKSPPKGPVTRKIFPFDEIIMLFETNATLL